MKESMHDLFYMAKEEGLTSSHNFIALFLQDEIFITAMHRFILVLVFPWVSTILLICYVLSDSL